MKLNDTDFSLQDRERVERELDSNEELLLACKPALSLWKPGYAYRMFFAALWNGFLFGILGMLFINHITLEKIIESLPFCSCFWGCFPFTSSVSGLSSAHGGSVKMIDKPYTYSPLGGHLCCVHPPSGVSQPAGNFRCRSI